MVNRQILPSGVQVFNTLLLSFIIIFIIAFWIIKKKLQTIAEYTVVTAAQVTLLKEHVSDIHGLLHAQLDAAQEDAANHLRVLTEILSILKRWMSQPEDDQDINGVPTDSRSKSPSQSTDSNYQDPCPTPLSQDDDLLLHAPEYDPLIDTENVPDREPTSDSEYTTTRELLNILLDSSSSSSNEPATPYVPSLHTSSDSTDYAHVIIDENATIPTNVAVVEPRYKIRPGPPVIRHDDPLNDRLVEHWSDNDEPQIVDILPAGFEERSFTYSHLLARSIQNSLQLVPTQQESPSEERDRITPVGESVSIPVRPIPQPRPEVRPILQPRPEVLPGPSQVATPQWSTGNRSPSPIPAVQQVPPAIDRSTLRPWDNLPHRRATRSLEARRRRYRKQHQKLREKIRNRQAGNHPNTAT